MGKVLRPRENRICAVTGIALKGHGVISWLIGKNESQSKLISTKQLDEITNAIKQFNDFCEQNDIMCYIEIAPRKVEFMKDKLLRKVFGQDPADVLYHHLKNSNITNVIYPHDALIKSNKENFVFFKTDHHWTEWGAYIGYKELMTRIKLDFPSIYIVSEDDYDIFYEKYLFKSPSKPLPWRASSLAIS